MPPAGIEPTIQANERPYTYALDRAATEIGVGYIMNVWNIYMEYATLQNPSSLQY
jgi:hypothetical protein